MIFHVSCSLTVCAVLKNWLMCGSLWDKMRAVVDFFACKHVTYLSLCVWMQNCRICGDCGARTPGSGPSSRWHLNYSVCDSCYQQRNKGLCCPACCKAYRHFTQSKMLLCSHCKR